MQRTKWTDRKFNFDIPEGWLPNILERLKGTEIRLLALTAHLSDDIISYKPNGKWSIKEHIGHLSDLEELHEGRIDDFIAGKEILRAADMSNTKTNQAEHNHKSIQQLIKEFAAKRNVFISRLEKLDDDTQKFQSLHPRLRVMMKPVDMAFFTAEHDDHHLASVREIINSNKKLKFVS
jgi:hypothetical protein